ncbi:putative GRX5-glutaredoxin [Pluteus cervinus]|uniref:GRX5-glutaredoxin n=1 Tax=Pluteus cervinus TaxID=181527 RepID=A0ACD3AVC6_9AGAR|nr:putative GRX5-glutaredoxin [Pluteus cervinus]
MFGSFLRSSTSVLRTATTAPTRTVLGRLPISSHYRFLSTEARAQIDKAVKSTPLVLFMKGTPDQPQCGFSRAVVNILDVYQVPPEKIKTYDVLVDAELRSGIKEYSEWPTIPQVYVNGEFVGGCDIVLGMHQSGELETLLETSNIIPTVPEPDAPATPQPAS